MSEETFEPMLVEVEPGANQSHSLGKLAAALAKAQLAFTPVYKESENPAFMRAGKASKYADLHSLISATRPALAANELVIIQSPSTRGKELVLHSLLLHSSGEFYRQEIVLPAADDKGFTAHSIGRAITYARRYSWQSLTGATAEEDDDGNDASGVGSREAAKAVADRKIAELQAKKNNGHEPDLIPQLQASLEAQKAKINFPDVPAPEPPKPRTDRGADVDDVVGSIKAIKELKTKQGRAYKSVTIEDIFGVVLELSAFDDFELSDGRLFQYLVDGALGQEATFTYVTKGKNGKQYHNIINVSRIGSHRWDDGVGVLDANR
jgi:ERF superfamily